MSNICSKYCFYDWFTEAKPKEKDIVEIYYEGMGPMRVYSDKDLVPFFGFVPGMHSSTLISGELGTPSTIRKDTFHFHKLPECIEYRNDPELRERSHRQILEWCQEFDSHGIIWHPMYRTLAEILKMEFGEPKYYDIITANIMEGKCTSYQSKE